MYEKKKGPNLLYKSPQLLSAPVPHGAGDKIQTPGSLVNIVKTKTSRFARKEYGETFLKKYYWKPYFWSDSYFITTVSENSLAVVREYIRNQ